MKLKCIKKVMRGSSKHNPLEVLVGEEVTLVEICSVLAYKTKDGRYLFPSFCKDCFEEVDDGTR